MEQLRAEGPPSTSPLAGEDPKPLLAFLRDRVHRLGSLFSTAELVQRATGAPLSIDALIRHLAAKAALWADRDRSQKTLGSLRWGSRGNAQPPDPDGSGG
jgi:hypothetical protein